MEKQQNISSQIKILVIEDEPDLQKALAMALKQKNYQVLQAFNGETGIEMYEKESPDLVLLDLILPKKDGFGVLEEIKKTSQTSDTPIIILTNLEKNTDIERAMELGVAAFFIKANYSLGEIIQKIEEILKKHLKNQ